MRSRADLMDVATAGAGVAVGGALAAHFDWFVVLVAGAVFAILITAWVYFEDGGAA